MGTFMAGTQVGAATLDDLNLTDGLFVSLSIGIKEDAECKGGVSLFGESFGDYRQPILVTIGYTLTDSEAKK